MHIYAAKVQETFSAVLGRADNMFTCVFKLTSPSFYVIEINVLRPVYKVH